MINPTDYYKASICVNAASWNDYVGGVMTTAACGGFAYDDLDHCVQLTGFDMTVQEPFYRVRNRCVCVYVWRSNDLCTQ
jgi:hypothetical protein